MDKSTLLIVGTIGSAIALAVAMINVSAVRPLSTLELVLWQILSLAVGLFASYRFGQNAAREAARDVVRPHARSTARHLVSLWSSLYRLSKRVEDFRSVREDYRLEIIQAIIEEQIPISNSAVEDWRDIVAEDIEEILEAGAEQRRADQDDDTD